MGKWESWPFGKIDHLSVESWISNLGERLAPRGVSVVVTSSVQIRNGARCDNRRPAGTRRNV
jgi:hypothetical protein